MNLFVLALVFSITMALYNIQQIKITLKKNGYDVEMLTGFLRDYREFKSLIENEQDQKKKIDYQKNLNGLHFSLLGSIIIAFFLLRRFL